MKTGVKDMLRHCRVGATCLPWRLAAATGLYQGEGTPVRFVVENADWAIRWVGEHVRDEIEAFCPGTIATTTEPRRLAHRIVHFGSQYMWLAWGRHMSRSNRYVTSFFHGKREDGPEVARHIDAFLASVPRLARIVTGAGLVELLWNLNVTQGLTLVIVTHDEVLAAKAHRWIHLHEGRAVPGSGREAK